MNQTGIYIGRGTPEMRGELLDFLNLAFGMNGHDRDLLKWLPKLYNEENDPCGHNYVITENGRIRAAVGVYPRTLHVLDETVMTYGVGNVAVHPYHRSKGYMKLLMNRAVQDMIEDGADMSDLGGRRQRYQYFSYESGGSNASFHFDTYSMRHCFGDAPMKEFRFEPVTDPESPWLEPIRRLHDKRPLHMERTADRFFGIASSWGEQLYVILEGERFAGYFIGPLRELTLTDEADFTDVLRAYTAEHGSLDLALPQYETGMIETAHKLCFSYSMCTDKYFSLFRFRKVVSAFMKLKASRIPLMDGSLTVQTEGRAGREVFRITVQNGIPSVTDAEEEPEIVLEHKEAELFFFGLLSPARTKHPLAAAWFPLPIRIEYADQV
ncbi:MAG: GNAT family N-acetyltransferase [Ruminococcaceae bacterium]|nr:GNAT family N-acetyltransferase [Oscillospiraceae bacterium]